MKSRKNTLILAAGICLSIGLTSCGGVTPNASSSSSSTGSSISESETSIGSITLSVRNELTLKEGETHKIQYELSGGEASVSFSSSDSSIASVDSQGLISAKKEGSAIILVGVEGYPGVGASISVTVEKAAPKQTYGFYTLKDGISDLSFLEGDPWLNTSIIGAAKNIERPSAKDDFFAHANYDLLQEVEIPEGEEKYGGILYQSRDLSDERIASLIKESDPALGLSYSLLLDGDKEGVVQEINGLFASSDEAIRDICRSKKMFHDWSNGLSINAAEGKPNIDFDYYNVDASFIVGVIYSYSYDKKDEFKEAMKHIAEAEGVAIDGFDDKLSDTMAKVYAAYAGSTSAQRLIPATVGELDTIFKGAFDMKSALKDLGYHDEDEITYSGVAQSFLANLDKCGIEVIRNLLAFSKIFYYRYYIGAEEYLTLYDEYLDDSSVFMDYCVSDGIEPEKFALNHVKQHFGEALCQDYAETYISESSRETVSILIEDIIEAYRDIINESQWLSKATRDKAIEKLNAMTYLPFYEDGLLEQERFSTSVDDLLNLYDAYTDYRNYPIASTGYDYDTLLMMTPYTANACYIPSKNKFIITHSIVATFIDNEGMTDEFVYGAIGMVIGHEISHGFDSNGANYDKDGKQANWWTEEDKNAFNQKVQKLVNYYNNEIYPFKDDGVNGDKLKGEVIADMGGCKVAMRLGEQIDGFNYDEMFKAFASFFAYVYTHDCAQKAKTDDVHPLSYLRVNVTLAQYDLFQNTYGIEEGDGMYIPAEERVAIW